MSHFVRLCTFTITFFLALAANAHDYPGGCISGGYQFNNNYLFVNDSGQQTFFMIQNTSPYPLQLERVQTKEAFMAPKLSIIIDPNQWAAFASDSKQLPFECRVVEGTNASRVDCASHVDLCQYPHVKFALSNMGTYWVSFNKPKADIIKDSVKTGIYLKW